MTDGSRKFVGHKGPIQCVAVPDTKFASWTFYSGSEDGTCRIWDLRERHCVKSIAGKSLRDRGSCVQSVVGSPTEEHSLYLAVSNAVLNFDLRVGGVLVTEPRAVFEYNDEEINQITLHPKSGQYLAACDDSGEVKVIDTQTGALYKTLRGRHSNICHTVQFRPRSMWNVASGSLDCSAVLWDFSRGSAQWSLSLSETGVLEAMDGGPPDGAGAANSQLVNPPLVYALQFDRSGRRMALGAGDGSLYVVDFLGGVDQTKSSGGRIGQGGGRKAKVRGAKKTSRSETRRKFGETHNSAVVALCPHATQVSEGGSLGGHGAGQSSGGLEGIFSAGNDNKLVLWDIAKEIEEEAVLWSAQHSGPKINWIAASPASSQLLVADISSELTGVPVRV